MFTYTLFKRLPPLRDTLLRRNNQVYYILQKSGTKQTKFQTEGSTLLYTNLQLFLHP